MGRLSSLSQITANALSVMRPMAPKDFPRLCELKEQAGLDYEMPDWNDTLAGTQIVLTDAEGEIHAAAALRLTAEAFLFLDGEWGKPTDRWLNVLALHEAIRKEAKSLGLKNVHAFLPPEVAKSFGRRLRTLGWIREPFEPWVRSTEGATWPEA